MASRLDFCRVIRIAYCYHLHEYLEEQNEHEFVIISANLICEGF